MTQGKQAEEIQNASTSPEIEANVPDGMHGTNHKRRQLLRGALGVAPVVMTLRSGALAASSCTGAQLIVSALDDKAQFVDNVGKVQSGDVCAIVTSATGCTEANQISGGTKTGFTAQNVSGNVWRCVDDKNNTAGIAGKSNIAILSSGSAQSLQII